MRLGAVLVIALACRGGEESASIREKELDVQLANAKAAQARAEAEKAKALTAVTERGSQAAPAATAACAQARVTAHDAWEKAEGTAKAALETVDAKARAATRAMVAASERTTQEIRNGADIHQSQETFQNSAENKNFNEWTAARDRAKANLNQITVAKTATSDGALKIRDAARAVRDDTTNAQIAAAKKASETAFDACKDVAP